MARVLVSLVNFNGERFLQKCLDGLAGQTFKEFDVMVVDNNSSDASRGLIERAKWIKYVFLDYNSGFAEGNNIVFRAALAGGYEYLALLNVDAVPSSNWLQDLMEIMEANSDIAIASSKLLFWTPFLPIQIIAKEYMRPCDVDSNIPDRRLLGVDLLSDPVNTSTDYEKGFYVDGWFPPDADGNRWTLKAAEVLVPYNSEAEENTIIMKVAGLPNRSTQFTIRVGQTSNEFVLQGDDPVELQLKVSKKSVSLVNVINNIGSYIDPEGYGHDIGFGSVDNMADGAFDVPAFCGANGLVRTTSLSEGPLFDEKLFMYYEDTDLSIRLRKKGWRVVVSTRSYVRHFHSGNSKDHGERTRFFIERNRLLTLARYGSLRQAIWAFRFAVRSLSAAIAYRLLGKHSTSIMVWAKILVSMVADLPGNFASRAGKT